MTKDTFSLAVHGGAGARRGRDYTREIAHMKGVVEAARDALRGGAAAIDVAEQCVAALEASGLYVAGRGASPNLTGQFELDAAIMDGARGMGGAVCALQGFESPVAVARAVLETTPHIMLAGEGAGRFATERGLARIAEETAWFTRAGTDESNHPPATPQTSSAGLAHGTVGCVVRDREGRLAGATSTGGVFGKMPGRVGDTPVLGSGTWADQACAISCTGQGEFFMKVVAAAQVAFRLRLAGQTLDEATHTVLTEIARMGGEGGMIAIDASGTVAMPYNSDGMKRAALLADGTITSAAFEL